MVIRVIIGALSLLGLLLGAGCALGGNRPPRLSLALPFGAVDRIGDPQSDGTLEVTGWVLSEDPVYTVSLYIDRHYVTSATLQQPRPDVNQAYPAFGSIHAGWRIDFDTTIFPGEHEILVQARTANGAVRDLGVKRMRFRSRS